MQVAITGSLSNRDGYSKSFLTKAVKLPALTIEMKKDVAVVSKDIGKNGNKVLDYHHFSVVFNKTKRLPFYTAVNVEGASNVMAMVHESRSSDVWYPDPRIVSNGNTLQYGNKDYEKSGFQRGHMVRYFDPGWGKTNEFKEKAMGDTFHYSNCCPQIPYYNSVVWNYLEDYYLARAIFQDKRITVFSGPIFNKAKQLNGLLVPVNFWKVVVYNKPGGKLGALGFVMSHERYLNKLKVKKKVMGLTKLVQPTLRKGDIKRLMEKTELIEAKVKISFIEEKTGLKFGLNNVDEKKRDKQYHVELIKPSSIGIMRLETVSSDKQEKKTKSLEAFFRAM